MVDFGVWQVAHLSTRWSQELAELKSFYLSHSSRQLRDDHVSSVVIAFRTRDGASYVGSNPYKLSFRTVVGGLTYKLLLTARIIGNEKYQSPTNLGLLALCVFKTYKSRKSQDSMWFKPN